MDQVKGNISLIKFTKSSFFLICGFFMILFLIGYFWWPLLDEYIRYFNPGIPFWQQVDLLLIGNFLVMSVLVMINADLKQDVPFLFISLAGGFIIEFWGLILQVVHHRFSLCLLMVWLLLQFGVFLNCMKI